VRVEQGETGVAVYVWEVERGCICFSLESVRGGEKNFYIEIQRGGGCSIGLRVIFLSIEWGRGLMNV
jgi:KaiC/GvpD/RAD55 family RecA-like ATPase